MRFVIYGVGAIGGTLAVKLARAGSEVIGIARGAMLEAIRAHGLTVETPVGSEHADFTCVAAPDGVDFRKDDVIVLCMKTQDTPAALNDLRAAGVDTQAIVCFQNGVENERLALRIFPNVYGAVLMMPTSYLKPGIVQAFGQPKPGIIDIGCYPNGTDETCERFAAALSAAGFACEPHPDVMRGKYGKLISNLGNAVQASIGREHQFGAFFQVVKAEALQVYAAAGIEMEEVGNSTRREGVMKAQSIGDGPRPGGSSWQSLARGGSMETDYLNGEIVLLGRLHGVPTPANEYFIRLVTEMASTGAPPESIPAERVAKELGVRTV